MLVGRMRRRAEFLAARGGRRLNGPFFFVETLRRPDDGEPRLGLTVTRKVGNAVTRNRIRRRLREAVRTRCGADMLPGFDYVIVARADLLHLPFERLADELSRRLAKAGEPASGKHGPRRAATSLDAATPISTRD